jgi:hypothetical protein
LLIPSSRDEAEFREAAALVVDKDRGSVNEIPIANGPIQDLILFSSDAYEPERGDWYGIYYGNGDANELKNCRICNGKTGVSLIRSSLEIKDSYIENCSEVGLYSQYEDDRRRIAGRESKRRLNEESAITKTPARRGKDDIGLEIKDCGFTNNSTGIWLMGEQDVEIKNSFILDSDDYGIIFEGEVEGEMKKDFLTGNNVAIMLKEESEIEIKNSYIIDNLSYGIYIEDEAEPEISKHNFIYGSGLFDVYNNTEEDIDAEENYWGTMNVDSVRAHIYDYYDDGSLGEVEILPLWDGDRGLGGTMSSGRDDIPLVYSLKSIKPNPFEDKATIHFSLAKPGNVSLCIYDVSGRLVRILCNEKKEAGAYNVRWNGYDNNNRKVPAGVYFTRLVASDFKSVKKIVLVR